MYWTRETECLSCCPSVVQTWKIVGWESVTQYFWLLTSCTSPREPRIIMKPCPTPGVGGSWKGFYVNDWWFLLCTPGAVNHSVSACSYRLHKHLDWWCTPKGNQLSSWTLRGNKASMNDHFLGYLAKEEAGIVTCLKYAFYHQDDRASVFSKFHSEPSKSPAVFWFQSQTRE